MTSGSVSVVLLLLWSLGLGLTEPWEDRCREVADACQGRWAGGELCVGETEEVLVGQTMSVVTYVRSENASSVYTIALEVEQDWIASVPTEIDIESQNCTEITVQTEAAGKTYLTFDCSNSTYLDNSSCPFNNDNLRLSRRHISVARSQVVVVLILVVGWIYTVVGIAAFYPQIFHNFRRRSVEGLSFAFLGLNFTGGLAYAIFNVGLFAIPTVKEEYFRRHPGGVNPVLLNDVVFSTNAAFNQGFIIFQCFILKRGKQRLSYSGAILLILLWLVMLVSLFVAVAGVLKWLDYLYIISYVKLAITPIKYIPQTLLNRGTNLILCTGTADMYTLLVWTHFKTKSTVGFSVGYTIFEIIFGGFSVLQMFLLSYNYDDWKSIFGDPTKFGLGALTVLFALFMLSQHLFYRSNNDSAKKDLPQDKLEAEIELDEQSEIKDTDKSEPNDEEKDTVSAT